MPPWDSLLLPTNGVGTPIGLSKASHVDDILVWATNPSELEAQLNRFLERCLQLYVTLSRSKFHIDTTLYFPGCVISDKGVSPDPNWISALSKLSCAHRSDSCPILPWSVQPVGFFIPGFQHHTVSLRQLTGKGRTFLWLPEHQVEFCYRLQKLQIS